MGKLANKKIKTASDSTASVGPNPAYAPSINMARGRLNQAYGSANRLNKSLLGDVRDTNRYYGRILDGKQLDGNPHLNKMIRIASKDIRDTVGSQFQRGGRYGSGMHTGVLARELGDMESNLRYGNYATERGYQDAAGGRILQGTGLAAALPQMASSTYADQINQLLGRYTSGTESSTGINTSSGGMLMELIRAGMQAGGTALASDRRLKRDIERIGEWDGKGDGLGRYRFIYKNDPTNTVQEGVMADEVKELRPWAYVPNWQGDYAGVNYGALEFAPKKEAA